MIENEDGDDIVKENHYRRVAVRFLRSMLMTLGGGAGTWYGIFYFLSGQVVVFGPFQAPHTVGLAVASVGTAMMILGAVNWKLDQKPNQSNSIHDAGETPVGSSFKSRH